VDAAPGRRTAWLSTWPGSIKRDGAGYPVEGAFISNEHLTALIYQDTNGQAITSSLTGSGYDLSLYRARRRVE
jgi:hypothetical protein